MPHRHERPLPRTNPSGRKVWVARATDRYGRRHYIGTRDLKREAQDLIDEFYGTDQAPAGTTTVASYFEHWLDRHPRSERTDVSYAQRIEAVLDVSLDGRKLRDWPLGRVERRQAVTLLDHMLREQGRAVNGARGILRVLSAMWQDAMDDGQATTGNPFIGLKVRMNDRRVTKAPRTIRVWSWEQMHRFAAATGEHEAMVRVLSDCGLRIGEMFPLERGDVHLGSGLCGDGRCRMEGPHLHVRRTAWRGRVTSGTKTDHGEAHAGRETPLPPALAEMLDARPRRIDTRLLFPTSTGTVFDRNFYRDVWEPARVATGMPATPHEFRHSFVSLLRASGMDPAKVAVVAGHTVATATGHYTHAVGSFDALRDAVGG